MVLMLAAVLGALWLLGAITGYPMGALIQLLLALAIGVALVRRMWSRKVPPASDCERDR